MRPAAAWIWAMARRARRGSGTSAGSSVSAQGGDERNPDHRADLGFEQPEPVPGGRRFGPAVADNGEHRDLPPCWVTAVTALVAWQADQAVLRQTTTSARPRAIVAG